MAIYYEKDLYPNKEDFYRHLVELARYRVRECDQSLNIGIYGQVGSGKTISALFLAEKIQEQTCPDVPFTADNLCYTATDFLRLLAKKDLPKGSVILWDEIGVGLNSRRAMSTINVILNRVFQVFRDRNLVFICATPSMSFIDKSTRRLFHFFLETKGINYRTKLSKISMNSIQYNVKLDKNYYHQLKLIIDGEKFKLPMIYTSLPSSELIKTYLAKKKIFTDKLYDDTLTKAKELENEKPLTENQQIIYDLNQQGLTQKEIADRLGLSNPRISVVLRAVKKKGYEIKHNQTYNTNPRED